MDRPLPSRVPFKRPWGPKGSHLFPILLDNYFSLQIMLLVHLDHAPCAEEVCSETFSQTCPVLQLEARHNKQSVLIQVYGEISVVK